MKPILLVPLYIGNMPSSGGSLAKIVETTFDKKKIESNIFIVNKVCKNRGI